MSHSQYSPDTADVAHGYNSELGTSVEGLRTIVVYLTHISGY